VYTAASSPDDRTLATGDADGTIQQWDVTDPDRPLPFGQPVTASAIGASVFTVGFSPDGHTLATGGGDSSTSLWDLNLAYAIDRICATTSDVLTPQRWHTYVPQLPYQPPCG